MTNNIDEPANVPTSYPEDHRGDTFRAVYVVRIAEHVHVLHAFQKKSKSGAKLPKEDIALIERRLKDVLQRYRESGRT